MAKMRKRPSLGVFTADDKEVLVMMVKMSQWKNLSGSKGPWKSFLASTIKGSFAYQLDPAKQPWHVLAAFLGTMRDNDIKLLKKFQEFMNYNQSIEILEKTKPFPSTPEEDLVQITRAHIRFKHDYKFESYNEGWIRSERGERGKINSPERLIGLDCEMVECKDGTREVVRVCVVGQNLETLIDTLVLPSKSVMEYKSHITGVSEDDLNSVTITQSDVQKQVVELLLPGTIVVGHSVHNDLKALKIDHRRVIDTQLLFAIHDRPPWFTPSLRDVCKAVLGYDFREDGKPHNCSDDAQVPMKLVLHHLEHGPSVLNIAYEVDESKLLLHKVPIAVKTTDLQSFFAEFSCEIQDAVKPGRNNSVYTTKYIVFKDKADANSAFALLQGSRGIDITGRLQKKVIIRLEGQHGSAGKVEVVVRKMGFDSSDAAQNPQNGSVQTTANISQQAQSGKGGKKDVLETIEKAERHKNLATFESSKDVCVETVAADRVHFSEYMENRETVERSMSGTDEIVVRKPKRSRREGAEDNNRLIGNKKLKMARNEGAQTAISDGMSTIIKNKKKKKKKRNTKVGK